MNCPVCAEGFDEPTPTAEQPAAAGVAQALGVPLVALIGIHDQQNRRRFANDVESHLRKHGPDDWLPVLMQTKNDLADALKLLAALVAEAKP